LTTLIAELSAALGSHDVSASSIGDLPRRFRPDDVRRACPGWANHTYGVFLPKHRRGYTEYFVQNPDGSYSLARAARTRAHAASG
jgi:hypothetical protein